MPKQRKSAAAIALAGGNAHKPRREDVVGTGAVGPWRERSADPSQIWDEIVAAAPPGLLTASDRLAVEAATRLIADMRGDPTKFSTAKGTLLVSILSRLGLTPAARLAMAVPEQKAPNDAQEKYFR